MAIDTLSVVVVVDAPPKGNSIIQGTPQPIYKVPLEDIPEENLRGIEIPAFLERLIIGPTRDPLAVWEAFRDVLVECGVTNPDQKVIVSDVPLRY
jgi:hypothetical protein